MVWQRLLIFIAYKIKLKARRRYSALEKWLVRFSFGKVILDNAYLIILALRILGSGVAAFAVYQVMRQFEFNEISSQLIWQILYAFILLAGCFYGLQVTGRALFPEDIQILARLPLSKGQLSVFVFADHLGRSLLDMLLLFVVPFFIPLVLSTREFITLEIVLPASVLVAVLASLSGFFFSLSIRSLNYYMLRRSAFWNTLLFQLFVIAALFVGSYRFATSLFAHFDGWLKEKPLDAFVNGDIAGIAQWIENGLYHSKELTYGVSSLLNLPWWPFSLGAEAVHKGCLLSLGLLTAQMLVALSLVIPLAGRFRNKTLADIIKISSPNRMDNDICNVLSHSGNSISTSNVLFKKNFLLLQRHLEIVRSGGIATLFGGSWIWITLGFWCAIGQALVGTYFAAEQYYVLSVAGTMALLTLLQMGVFDDSRYLLSIDGEGRNISLLRLAKISLTDLYVCRVRLLRVVALPASLLLVLILGIAAQLTVINWLWLLAGSFFVFINTSKTLLLSSVLSPRFDTPHFEESGKFVEHNIVEGIISNLLLFPLFSIGIFSVVFVMTGDIISPAISIMAVVICYGLITVVGHMTAHYVMRKLGNNIRQAEGAL